MIPLQPLAAQVEPAVAKAKSLVDVLLVELERERRRAREDPQLVDLHLDLARRKGGVDELGRARHYLARCLKHELVPDLVCDLGRSRRALRVDDQLQLPCRVAEVDEDEPTVVAAGIRPAGDRDAAAGVARAQLSTHRVAPAHSSARVCTTRSTSPRLRTS